MKIITESEMNFGKFDETDLFHIENSKIYKALGSGIKTVEFVLKYDENSIVFLEAKKSCPNAANRNESKEKEQKFEEYYSSITEKFIASLQIYLAAILDKFQNSEEVGDRLRTVNSMKDIQLKFILVVKNMRVAVIVHEHHQLLAAKSGQIRVALLGVKIPKFKNDIIVVARAVTFHTMQHIKKQIYFIFAGAFMRVVQHLKELFKARSPEYPHIILQFTFHLLFLLVVIIYPIRVLRLLL